MTFGMGIPVSKCSLFMGTGYMLHKLRNGPNKLKSHRYVQRRGWVFDFFQGENVTNGPFPERGSLQTFPPQSVKGAPSCPGALPWPRLRAGPQPQVSPSPRAGGPGRAALGGVRDFLSGRGAEGSRCQPRRPAPPPLPLGGGVSQPGGGRRAGLGFLSEDAQGSGRRGVCECVSVCVGRTACLRPWVPPPPLPPLLTV